MQAMVILGGPGSGKTATALRIMDKLLLTDIKDPLNIGFISFTRAARREASERAGKHFGCPPELLEHKGYFRTIHSVAHKVVGVQKGQLLTGDAASRAWLKNVLQAEIETADEDERSSFEDYRTKEARALGLWDLSRNRMEPVSKTHEWLRRTDDTFPLIEDCWKVICLYEEAKRAQEKLDFTDLLVRCAGLNFDGGGWPVPFNWGVELPDVPAWLIDEAQDNSTLVDAVCQKITVNARWAYLFGDPYQCQPAGVTVKTASGYKNIEDLNGDDNVIAFNKRDGIFYGSVKKLNVTKATRIVDSGEICEIVTDDGDVLKSTFNHKWYARFSWGEFICVYLMQRGTRWRVGTCITKGKQAESNRITMRMTQEGAEGIWILKMFSTDKEARAYEQIVSYRYGIPQVCFRPPLSRRDTDSQNMWFIDTVFDALGDLTEKATSCLRDHFLHPGFPFLGKKFCKTGPAYGRDIEACNLLPGISMLPKYLEKTDNRSGRKKGVLRTDELAERRKYRNRVKWVKVRSIRRMSPGIAVPVYSLDVEKHHTYITDGYITCNCIFGWCGADPQAMLQWQHSRKEILPQSYRCPAEFLTPARAIVRKTQHWEEHEFKPKDGVGILDHLSRIGSVPGAIDPKRDTLVLARSNYLAGKLAAELTAARIPWRPTRGKGGFDAPKKVELVLTVAALKRGETVDGERWASLIRKIPVMADGVRYVDHGFKTKLDDPDFCDRLQPVTLPSIIDNGGTPELRAMLSNGHWTDLVKGTSVIHHALLEHGEELLSNPQVRLGTVHAAKGLESSHVILWNAITEKIVKATKNDRARLDEERRVWYVGMTRAKERLTILQANRQDGVAHGFKLLE